MKKLLAPVFLALLLACRAHAQNLVQNGDFETGSVVPWSLGSGGATLVTGTAALRGNGSILFSGSGGQIWQFVTTTKDARYFASASLAGAGVQLLVSGSVQLLGYTPTLSHGFIFTATDTNTYLFAQDVSGNGRIDDISVVAIPAVSALAGRYKGTATGLLANATVNAQQHASEAAQAVISPDNTIMLMHGARYMYGGFLLDNGIFELAMNTQYTATGTATIHGKTITLTVPYFSLAGSPNFTDQFSRVLGSASLTFKLTRVGK